jgi:RNA polymerase sigma factor (sigma-70 family)
MNALPGSCCHPLNIFDHTQIGPVLLMVTFSNAIHDGFANRDTAVLEQVYKELYPTVRSFVVTNNGTNDDARDVFQEAVMAAWLNVRSGKYRVTERSSLYAYIAQIARYKWLDQLKSSRHRLTSRMDDRTDIPADVPTETDTLEAVDQVNYLSQLYGTLGEQCRTILSLFYYEKRSLEEIGKQLNYDASTIRTMKYRCMMKLRKNHMQNQERSTDV